MGAALALRSRGDAAAGILGERLDVLEAENRWLKQMLAPPGFLPKSFQLTSHEARTLKALLSASAMGERSPSGFSLS